MGWFTSSSKSAKRRRKRNITILIGQCVILMAGTLLLALMPPSRFVTPIENRPNDTTTRHVADPTGDTVPSAEDNIPSNGHGDAVDDSMLLDAPMPAADASPSPGSMPNPPPTGDGMAMDEKTVTDADDGGGEPIEEGQGDYSSIAEEHGNVPTAPPAKQYVHRLIVAMSDGSSPDGPGTALGSVGPPCLLGFETEAEMRDAKVRYEGESGFVAEDIALSMAQDEPDGTGGSEPSTAPIAMTADDNPFDALAEAEGAHHRDSDQDSSQGDETQDAIDETVDTSPADGSSADGSRPGEDIGVRPIVALLDTGAPASGSVVESVSMLGDDGIDRNGHATSMLDAMRGQNPDVRVMSVKVLNDEGHGTASNVYAGTVYAVDNGARILNMSFAGFDGDGNAAMHEAVRYALDRGVTVIAAAGNGGYDTHYITPANIEGVLTVGAADGSKVLDASNRGEEVDLYVQADSTSVAAAVASGWLSANFDAHGRNVAMSQAIGVAVGIPDKGKVPVAVDGVDAQSSLNKTQSETSVVLNSVTITNSVSNTSGRTYEDATPAQNFANNNPKTASYVIKIDGTQVTSGSVQSTGSYSYQGASMYVAAWDFSKTVSLNKTYNRGHSAASHTVTITWSGAVSGTQTLTLSVPARTSYTVAYNANGGSGAPGSQTKWYGESLTLSSTKPTKTGYNFAGWNTASNGSGTNYSAGGSYTANSGATLYAKWTAIATAITVNPNGGSVTLSDSNFTYTKSGTYSSAVKVTNFTYDSGSFSALGMSAARTGYTPTGLWTAASGGTKVMNWTGSRFDAIAASNYWSAAFASSNNPAKWKNTNTALTLYVQWSVNQYYIDLNGTLDGTSSGGVTDYATVDVYVPNTTKIKTGVADYYAQSNYGTTYKMVATAKAGKHFVGGNTTSQEKSGTLGAGTADVRFALASYATVDRVTAVQVDGNQFYAYAYVSDHGGGINRVQFPTWTSANNQDDLQSNWSTNTAAAGTSGSWTISGSTYNYRYLVKATDHKNEHGTYNVHVYAYDNYSGSQMKGLTFTFSYSVAFNANGGTGTTASMTLTEDATKALTTNGFSRTGYQFKGWNTKSDGTGISYTNGQNVRNIHGEMLTNAQQAGNGWFNVYPASGISAALPSQVTDKGITSYAKTTTRDRSVNAGLSLTAGKVYKISGYGIADSTAQVGSHVGFALIVGGTNSWPGGTLLPASTRAWTYNEYWMTVAANTTQMHPWVQVNGWPSGNANYDGTNGVGGWYWTGLSVRDMSVTSMTLYAQWEPISYQIAFDHNSKDTVASGLYHSTGVKVDTNRNFTATGTMTLPSLGRRYVIVSNFDTGAANVIFEITAENKVRVYLAAGNQDVRSTGTVVANKELSYVATWNASSKTASITVTGDGTNVSLSATSTAVTGTASTPHVIGGTDIPRANTATFSQATGVSSVVTPTVTYDTNYAAPAPTRIGYTFREWTTGRDGTGTRYAAGASLRNIRSTAGTTTLYAQWDPITYTVTYDGNGATGGSTEPSTHAYDVTRSLTANGYRREGHTFMGWSGTPDGEVSHFDLQSIRNLTTAAGTTIPLYAVWQRNHTVRYDANGGTGSVADSSVGFLPYAATDGGTPTRAGHRFAGWNSHADGSGSLSVPGGGHMFGFYAQEGTYAVTDGLITLDKVTPYTGLVWATDDATRGKPYSVDLMMRGTTQPLRNIRIHYDLESVLQSFVVDGTDVTSLAYPDGYGCAYDLPTADTEWHHATISFTYGRAYASEKPWKIVMEPNGNLTADGTYLIKEVGTTIDGTHGIGIGEDVILYAQWEPLEMSGTEDPLNPDTTGDGIGDNISVSAPTSVTLAVKADGTLVAPTNASVINHGGFDIRLSSVDVQEVAPYSVVRDVMAAPAGGGDDGDDRVHLVISAGSSSVEAADCIGKTALPASADWDMPAGGSLRLGLSGEVRQLGQSAVTGPSEFATLTWYVTPWKNET